MSLPKSFSEFLVEQKLVTTDHLVDLLIHQSKANPSVVEIVRTNRLLEPSQILACLGLQMRSENPFDFVTAAKDLGYWSQSLSDGILKAQSAAKVPLAELLQKSGLVSTHNLALALDNYLSGSAQAPVAAMPAPAALAEESISQEIAHAGLQETPVAAPAEEASHFAEFYSGDVHAKLMTTATAWNTSNESATQELIATIHGLVGAARFAKLEPIELLFKEAESSVRGAADLPAPLDEGLMSALRSDLVSILERARASFENAQEKAA